MMAALSIKNTYTSQFDGGRTRYGALNVDYYLSKKPEPVFKLQHPICIEQYLPVLRPVPKNEQPVKSHFDIDNLPPGNVYMGPLTLGFGDLVADLAGKTHDVYSNINFFQGREDPVGLAGLGVASIFWIFTGGFMTYDGIREQYIAKKIGDAWGRGLACLKTARGTVLTIAATITVPLRGLTLAAIMTTSRVVTAVAGVFSNVAGGLFSFLSCICLAIYGMKIHEQRGFNQKLDAVLNDPALSLEQRNLAALAHLKEALCVSPHERAAIQTEVNGNDRYTRLPAQEKQAKIERKAKKLLLKKEAVMNRCLSGKALSQIRQATNADAADVIAKVQSVSRKNMILNAIGLTLAALGVASIAIAFIFSGPTPLFVVAILSVIVTIGLFVTDLYYLLQDFKASEPGRYDKLCLLLSSVMGVVVTAAAVCLAANWVALTCAAVFGLVWLIINLICYLRLRQLSTTTG